MNSFRLYKTRFEEKNFETNNIQLVHSEHTSNSNYISLIVGNNGTGKSRILSRIARFFVNKMKDNNQDSFQDSMMYYNTLPRKIIAITNSISDKFPIDESFRPSRQTRKNISYRDFKYNYLGTRNRTNSFSNRALMNRALDIIFENYSELDVSRNYRYIFDYLDYEPILKLHYKISRKIFNLNGLITANILIDYLNNENSTTGFRKNSHEQIDEIIGDKIYQLCNFLNDYNNGKDELLINFSAKNISRITDDNSRYENIVDSYHILQILKELNLIRELDIKVYKKGGTEFNFNEASSGEANILSTLIALIPLIQDNSLILIDEPEISLHPFWQSQYIALINNIFSSFNGCHIIIASHSHFLVTDLLPEKSSVISLKNHKGIIKSELLDEPTYGWSAEEILYSVFNVKTVRNHFLESDLVDLLGMISDGSSDFNKIKSLLQSIKSLNITANDPLNVVIEEATAYLGSK